MFNILLLLHTLLPYIIMPYPFKARQGTQYIFNKRQMQPKSKQQRKKERKRLLIWIKKKHAIENERARKSNEDKYKTNQPTERKWTRAINKYLFCLLLSFFFFFCCYCLVSFSPSFLFISILLYSVLGCVLPRSAVALCQNPPTFCPIAVNSYWLNNNILQQRIP